MNYTKEVENFKNNLDFESSLNFLERGDKAFLDKAFDIRIGYFKDTIKNGTVNEWLKKAIISVGTHNIEIKRKLDYKEWFPFFVVDTFVENKNFISFSLENFQPKHYRAIAEISGYKLKYVKKVIKNREINYKIWAHFLYVVDCIENLNKELKTIYDTYKKDFEHLIIF